MNFRRFLFLSAAGLALVMALIPKAQAADAAVQVRVLVPTPYTAGAVGKNLEADLKKTLAERGYGLTDDLTKADAVVRADVIEIRDIDEDTRRITTDILVTHKAASYVALEQRSLRNGSATAIEEMDYQRRFYDDHRIQVASDVTGWTFAGMPDVREAVVKAAVGELSKLEEVHRGAVASYQGKE